MAAQMGIHEPLSPPLHLVTDAIQGPYIFLAAEIMIVLSGLVVAAKLHMSVSIYHKLRSNDFAIVMALVLAIGYTVAICTAADQGLGSAASELSKNEVRKLSQSYYASNILLFLSLGSSKSAVALLVLGFQPARWVRVSSYALVAISTIWAFAAAFTVAFQCSPDHWALGSDGNDTCIDQFGAQVAIRVIDIITDIALALLPALMVAGINMTRSKRLIVAFLFAVRLLTPIFTAISIASLNNFYNKATVDRPYAAVTPSIWTSIMVNVSLMTACVPSIKRLIGDWKAGIVNAGITEPYELQYSTGHSRSARGIGLRIFGKPQSRTVECSRSDRKVSAYNRYSAARAGDVDQIRPDGESETALTEGIVQTVDFRVDYSADQAGVGGPNGVSGHRQHYIS